MLDCLSARRAPECVLAGSAPIIDRGFRQTRFREVMSHNLRLGCHNIGAALLESPCNVAMQLLTTALEQRFIRRVAHECMVELEVGVRCSPSAEQQPCLG